jgi:hypothetical protein
MTTKSNKRSDQVAADQAMIDGIQKFLSQLASMPVGSQNMTPADIVKVFQARVDAGKAVQTANAARITAVKANKDERQKTSAFVQAFRRIVVGMFLQSPDTLAVFNLTAPKAAKRTVATKSAAVAKSKATRTARNTMGSKQKKSIKGSVPEASTAPAEKTPAATSGPTPAPAPAVLPPKPTP